MRIAIAQVCQPLADKRPNNDASAAASSRWNGCGSNCEANARTASRVTGIAPNSRTQESKPVPIVIEAQVVPSENQGLIAAAEMLSECLGTAVGQAAWPVRLEVNAPGAGLAQTPIMLISFRAVTSRATHRSGS